MSIIMELFDSIYRKRDSKMITDTNLKDELDRLHKEKDQINKLLDNGVSDFKEESKLLRNLEAVCDQIEMIEELQAEELAEKSAFVFGR